jgi:dihydropyrimidine dehydrogenase (NAD+) subunit PreA
VRPLPHRLRGQHQAITHRGNGERRYEVIEAECVGCNLCALVCPVDGCITLQPLTEGIDPRTDVKVGGHRTWLEDSNNPGAAKPAERALEPAE